MYKKCFKIDYHKDTQEKDMQDVVQLLEKNNYICVHGITIGEGGKNNKHHILVCRKYKDETQVVKQLTSKELQESFNILKSIKNKSKRRNRKK